VCVKHVSGVDMIDAEAWWGSVQETPVREKLSELLANAGVEFWDDSRDFVKTPTVSLSAIGGIPLRLRGGDIPDGCVELSIGGSGPVVSIADLADSLRRQMGMAAFPSYLNPKGIAPLPMWNVVAEHRHFSVGHSASLSFVMAGHSCAVENEFNCQRDVVHLGRLTVARTAAQVRAPVVVPFEELLPAYKMVKMTVDEQIAETKNRPEGVSVGDWQEARFTIASASKAHLAVITGSLRNFQKLVGEISSGGKEREYIELLRKLNDSLHGILPDMFQPSDSYLES